MRILVVDDDTKAVASIEAMLQSAGHEVVGFARDENSSLAVAALENPDLALIDSQLIKGASGGATAREISARYNIPTLLISGSMGTARDLAKQSRALGCLIKPFTAQHLMRQLLRSKPRSPENSRLTCQPTLKSFRNS